MKPQLLHAVSFAGFVLASVSVQATPVFVGGNGAVAFGVAPYGGPPVGAPTYITNNVYGTNDVLTSPGNGFLTANTAFPNNLASGAGSLPGGGAWVGDGNMFGMFGSGSIALNSNSVGFSLTDINPDGAGAAAYAIGTWQSAFFNNAAWSGTYGNVLGIRGSLSTVSSAAAVSLRTRLIAAGGVFGGGFTLDFPQLVLAASGNGNFQALGGSGAALQFYGGNLFRGLAFNNLGLINMVGGELIQITSTLTIIADPASLTAELAPVLNTEMGTGFSMADLNFTETSANSTPTQPWSVIPEPSTYASLAGVVALFVGFLVRRRKS